MITERMRATTMRRYVGALVAVAALGTGGCATAAGQPVPSAPGRTSSPAPSGHPLGDRVPADNALVDATVFTYQQPAARDAAPPQPSGYEWSAIDVQACASATSVFTVSVSSTPWLLRYGDGSQVAPSRTSDPHFPQPAYPSVQTSLSPGQCVRGWIEFAVPSGTRPVAVRYAPHGAEPVDWAAG